MDPDAIRAHAARVHERMLQTPPGPKRKRLAEQHVELSNKAIFAKGAARADALEDVLRRMAAEVGKLPAAGHPVLLGVLIEAKQLLGEG